MRPCETQMPIYTGRYFFTSHKTLDCVCNPDSDVKPCMHSRLHNQFPVNIIAWLNAFKEFSVDDAVSCIPAMHVQANTSSCHLQESTVTSPASSSCPCDNANIRNHAHAACSRCLCDHVKIYAVYYIVQRHHAHAAVY